MLSALDDYKKEDGSGLDGFVKSVERICSSLKVVVFRFFSDALTRLIRRMTARIV